MTTTRSHRASATPAPRLSRATFLRAGGLAGLLAMTACSAQDGPDGEAAAGGSSDGGGEPGSLPAAEGITSYPLTLTTAWGETELGARPERIAAVSPTGRDSELLALLGVTPVIAPETVERGIWTLDALPGEIEELYPADHTGVTPHELVAAASPDLIVVFGKSIADEFEQLSAIAPIVAAGTEEAAVEADWRAELTAIGEALDLPGTAEDAIATHEGWFAQAREENPEFDGLTATFLVQYSEEYGLTYFSTTGSDTEEIFLDLGFDPNPLAEQFVDDADVSTELLSQIEADVLVVANTSEGGEEELERLLTGNELFQNLDVVERGHVAELHSTDTGYTVEGTEHEGNLAWALASGGPLAKQWAAEQLIPVLQAALDH